MPSHSEPVVSHSSSASPSSAPAAFFSPGSPAPVSPSRCACLSSGTAESDGVWASGTSLLPVAGRFGSGAACSTSATAESDGGAARFLLAAALASAAEAEAEPSANDGSDSSLPLSVFVSLSACVSLSPADVDASSTMGAAVDEAAGGADFAVSARRNVPGSRSSLAVADCPSYCTCVCVCVCVCLCVSE